MSKHTAGNWTFVPFQEWPFGVSVMAGDNCVLQQSAICHSSKQKTRKDCEHGIGFTAKERPDVRRRIAEQDANARLIAAAPELLAVLRDLLNSPNIKKCPEGLWSTADCVGYALVRDARAAITKATGE